MLREPRGYPAANCNVILPPTRPEAQAGFVIMEQVEYPAMSGTNTNTLGVSLDPQNGRKIARVGVHKGHAHAGSLLHRHLRAQLIHPVRDHRDF